MLLANGDVRRLVLGKEARCVALRHRERPPHHHPMLGSVVVALQRQRATGLHHDALHLIALASIEALVPAPRAVDAVVLERDVLAVAFR